MDVFGLGVLIMGESGVGQVGMRARPHRSGPSTGRGRRGRDQAHGRHPPRAPLPTSRDTTWSFAASASSTSRTSTGCPRSGSPSAWSSWSTWSAGRRAGSTIASGLRDEKFQVLGVELPLIRMPVAPGPEHRDPGGGGGPQPASQGSRLRRGTALRGARRRRDGGRASPARRPASAPRRRAAGPAAPAGASMNEARATGPRVLVITGLSGSGKTHVSRALEDAGWFCVDNLPIALIPPFVELVRRWPEPKPSALVVDVREPEFVRRFPEVFGKLRQGRAGQPPLPGGGRAGAGPSLQRDPPPPPPGLQPAGRSRGSARSGRRSGPSARWPISSSTPRPTPCTSSATTCSEHYALRSETGRLVLAVMSFGYKFGVPAGSRPRLRPALPPEPELRAPPEAADRAPSEGGGLPRSGNRRPGSSWARSRACSPG